MLMQSLIAQSPKIIRVVSRYGEKQGKWKEFIAEASLQATTLEILSTKASWDECLREKDFIFLPIAMVSVLLFTQGNEISIKLQLCQTKIILG